MTNGISGVRSPCIKVCQLESGSGLCTGCLRTGDEIGEWGDAGDKRRLEILARAEQRRRERARSSAKTGRLVPCLSCGGSGQLTAQRSGDWRREPDRYQPGTLVPCRICGTTGWVPRPGTFDEV